ncbi:hypothetical protein [Mycobacterium asiaticum]|nr:hypothetical protein [Mycobacterium asiaticum]
MAGDMYHATAREIHYLPTGLAPHTHDAFEAFSRAGFVDGA